MKKITLQFFSLFIMSGVLAQSGGSNGEQYFKSAAEVKGKRTAYTELLIKASPTEVRDRFLRLEDWPTWNSVITKVVVLEGNLNDASGKTRIDALFHMDTTKVPQKAPMKLWLTENNEEAFVWEVKSGLLLKAYHVFLFLPAEDGKATRLIHYEKMTGFLSLFMSKKVKNRMVDRYGRMNEDLKKICEG